MATWRFEQSNWGQFGVLNALGGQLFKNYADFLCRTFLGDTLWSFSKQIQQIPFPDRNIYNDIALVKLDKPIDFVTGKTSPIGLPDKKYNEIGKNVYVAGQGFVYQQSWHTNGDGPEPYTECAPGAVFEGKKWDQEYGCQQGHSPSMEKVDGKENPCFHFNYQQKNKVHTSSNSYKCA